MADIKLHIVSFAIPDPPDYGGIIDVFYKIKYLAEAGVKIYLHCSQYDERLPSAVLESWCEKVWYYPRHTGVAGLSMTLPYIVYSRRGTDILNNLQAIDAPILFDGLSTAYYLDHPALRSRLKILRPQNVEQDYYRLLAKRTRHSVKRLYYTAEALLLKRLENRLNNVDVFFTVAQHDHEFFRKKYPVASHHYLPSFQPYTEITSQEGSGDFTLYHGNLSVEENEEAALFLLEQVCSQTDTPLYIAGKNPTVRLLRTAKKFPHCAVIANPDKLQMEELIAQAHIHVLPTFQSTGLKLKLLHGLFNGRHVLVNEEMLTGTGLQHVCHIASDATGFAQKIKELMKVPFTKAEILRRKAILMNHYDNRKNAAAIVTYLQQRSL
ncbi:MAG TPA: glycosyltransferase [Flavipsychrobacter sp.]|nr:glycosyltransferase [Flavipsychrobacter sp.]